MKRAIACQRLLLLLAGFFVWITIHAQTKQVTGKVTSEDGSPLAGISITVKGKPSGTQTAADGTYSILADANDVLVFSSVGHEPAEVSIGASNIRNVSLKTSDKKMDEVVVVGYGKQSRRTLTGAVSSVDQRVLESAPRTNAATALQGTVSGLRVQQTSGAPGATPNIVFRGGTDFGGGGSPLFIVDGIIVPSLYGINAEDIESMDLLKDAASTAIYGARASNGVVLVTTRKGKKGKTQVNYNYKYAQNYVRRNPVEYLSAADYIKWNRRGLASRYEAAIASGSTADANNAKGQITGSWGWAPAAAWTAKDGKYSTQLVTDANRNLLNDPQWNLLVDPNPFNSSQVDSILFRSISQRELEDLILQESSLQEHYLNVSGANEQGNFALGLGTIKDVGMVVGSSLKRFNLNFNGGLNVGKALKLGLNVNAYNDKSVPSYLTADNSGGLTGGLIQRFGGIAPTVRLTHDSSGAILPGVDASTLGNPLYFKDKFLNNTLEQRFAGGVNLEYTILPYLKVLASGSGFIRYNNNETFNKEYQNGTGGAIINTRRASFAINRYYQYNYNAFLQFDKNYNRHNITAMAGGEYFERKNNYFRAAATGQGTDVIPYLTGATLSEGVPQSGYDLWHRMTSAIGRVNYGYGNRYLLTVNLRYDGTSKLKDNRYGFFPGISAGWNMHNEDFFNKIPGSQVISTFKPRISWGKNGNINDDILGDFATNLVYNNLGIYNGYTGYGATSLINTALVWESATSTNFGLDLGLFNNRLTIITDYFIRNVYDKLASLSIPRWTGYSGFTTNLSQLQNRGIEMDLKANILRPTTPDGLRLDLGANLFHVKNFAKTLPDNGLEKNRQGAIQIYDEKSGQLVWVGGLQEGERVGLDEIYAPMYDGIYRTQAELDKDANVYNTFLPYTNKRVRLMGDARWLDRDGNDTINSFDYVYVGRTTPTLQGGFNTFFGWKGLSLFAQMDYSLGFKIANQSWLRGMSQVQGSQNGPVDIKDTWTPENPDAKYPRYYWANYGRNFFTDAGGGTTAPANYWQKGDYLALREVTLSYDFSRAFLKKKLNNKVQSFRLYVSGSNLIYFTGYDGTLPEQGGNDVGRFPLPRRVTFGANITL
ncbi:SusC/RagA family TonB-linked outer membrane protein [Chitinophagaceae bacterium LB-8]|uniref:SusC/RagA family TonB-linked outer membrane protein n=1 Tax=Paraflavisolibacter caeni TaxID=2982496 RepID=A0A9X2XWP0_9BACT|nr:SusC/RagA family TonB-linked outer membrane protein [Paraflavisolibacter caeni]MCU7550455.1 SusC/RagA family TonB-linked outer membrane protein [Paraflavisolibacter caeni]